MLVNVPLKRLLGEPFLGPPNCTDVDFNAADTGESRKPPKIGKLKKDWSKHSAARVMLGADRENILAGFYMQEISGGGFQPPQFLGAKLIGHL
ncbi:MAG TPA: hypothetical protein VJT54_05000 [Verrucomicrobiae bacterium]|nr:hypothetical protein [Verrucomicrobiae bacterium]